jgi:hypothetical protein
MASLKQDLKVKVIRILRILIISLISVFICTACCSFADIANELAKKPPTATHLQK